MRFIANILWFLLGGLVLALLWTVVGLVLCVTVVGIPLGLQFFKLAKLSLFPYGKKVHLHFGKHPLANILWAVTGGWVMAIVYFACGLLNCVTIIGIPSGIQCFKIMKLSLFPFGAKVQ